MSARLLLTVMCLSLLCSACGFQLREDAELPPEMAQTRLVIDDENSTLARRVRILLEGSGVNFVGQAQATAILEIPVNHVVTEVLTIGDNARVREYRISHTVKFRVTDAEAKRSSPCRPYARYAKSVSMSRKFWPPPGSRNI